MVPIKSPISWCLHWYLHLFSLITVLNHMNEYSILSKCPSYLLNYSMIEILTCPSGWRLQNHKSKPDFIKLRYRASANFRRLTIAESVHKEWQLLPSRYGLSSASVQVGRACQRNISSKDNNRQYSWDGGFFIIFSAYKSKWNYDIKAHFYREHLIFSSWKF